MPIRQFDADRNIQQIKTLDDVTVATPLPVSIPGTLTSTDTVVQGRLGGTNSTPAALPTADTSLNGVIKGFWLDVSTRFLSLFGGLTDAASSTGSLMARLRKIAEPVFSSPVDIASVSVTTTTSTIAEIVTADWDYLTLWIQNTGTVALNELKIEAGISATLLFKYAYLAGTASSTSYSTGTGRQSGNSLIPIIFANNLPAIAAGGDGFVEIDVRRYQRIRLQASVASGSTTVAINGTLFR